MYCAAPADQAGVRFHWSDRAPARSLSVRSEVHRRLLEQPDHVVAPHWRHGRARHVRRACRPPGDLWPQHITTYELRDAAMDRPQYAVDVAVSVCAAIGILCL